MTIMARNPWRGWMTMFALPSALSPWPEVGISEEWEPLIDAFPDSVCEHDAENDNWLGFVD